MQELVLIQPSGTLGKESAREAAQAEATREFEARLAECGPLAYRVARGVLRNTADAEDVAQEALLRAYRSFDRLRDRNRFRAWLVRISFRIALDRLRSARRREQREVLWSQPAHQPPAATAEDLAASSEFQAHLDRALEELPEKPRLVLLLAAMEGHTSDEIAALLGIPRRHGEIPHFCRPKAVSGEVAMPCEHYQDALIEAAASSTAPQGELRAHLAACAACRAAFVQEQSLFSSIDTGICAKANAEVPASLLPRVRARLADKAAPIGSWRFPSFVFAGAAAMVVVLLVARTAWQTNVEQHPTNSVSNSTPSSALGQQPQGQNSNAAPPVTGKSVTHTQEAATKLPAHPASPATRDSTPEVLVPPDQELLLVSYAEQWHQQKRLPLVAANFDSTNLSPLKIAPIQIAQLDVKLMAEEQAQ